MKEILFWRRLDFAGQMLMLLPLVAVVSPAGRGYAGFVYLTLGVWHLVSTIVNAVIKPRLSVPARKSFNIAAAWILGIFVTCIVGILLTERVPDQSIWDGIGRACTGIAWVEACMMLVGGPMMAIWYFSITIDEIQLVKKAINHRSEVHWKL
jgi:hypothetical protein